jgi:hypothetical protein
MTYNTQKISRKGRQLAIPSISLGPSTRILLKGRILKIGEIFDEFWIQSKDLMSLPEIVAALQNHPDRPDILTSTQKLPNTDPIYPYSYEWMSYAVARFGSYAEWFENQVDRMARKAIRKSAKEGIRTEIVPFDDELVKGICSIYNESPIRQGSRFWHYQKDADRVKAENGTYLERSVFIGAFYDTELVGFAKIVFDAEVASLMQILSKSSHFGKRPNNALLSKAVEVCEQRAARYLTYGQYAYGKKEQGSLVEFKRVNGFVKMEVPRYIIALSRRGRAAMKLGLHKSLGDRVPVPLSTVFIRLRAFLLKKRWHHPGDR